jgi:hypothetical protein
VLSLALLLIALLNSTALAQSFLPGHGPNLPPLPPSGIQNLRPIKPTEAPNPNPPINSEPYTGGRTGTDTGSGSPPSYPAPASLYFVITVCANTTDATPQCLSQSVEEAKERLVDMYKDAALRQYSYGQLRIVFPRLVSRTQQLEALIKMEKAALAMVEAKMRADITRLSRPWDWIVEREHAVREWQIQADSEAERGSNWQHNWGTNSHDFGRSNALRQLQKINLSGWGRT